MKALYALLLFILDPILLILDFHESSFYLIKIKIWVLLCVFFYEEFMYDFIE